MGRTGEVTDLAVATRHARSIDAASETLEWRLLDDFQRGFPLTAEPFAVLAQSLRTTESRVLATLSRLIGDGRVSRVGAVFRPGSVGASTLAAMSVPESRLSAVAEVVGAHQEVNHSYERDHELNLWFVVTAADETRVMQVLGSIECETQLDVIPLPLVTDYYIDLGFRLGGRGHHVDDGRFLRNECTIELDDSDRALLGELQEGLPLVARPFAALGRRAGWRGSDGEREVISRIRSWIECGAIKRFGVVVRHRSLGYVANAMCAWDVPAWDIDRLGRLLAREPMVTMCYHRVRGGTAWPYNLYCVIHARQRQIVDEQIAALSYRYGLDAYPHALLFSLRAFKQRGARYVEPTATEALGRPRMRRLSTPASPGAGVAYSFMS